MAGRTSSEVATWAICTVATAATDARSAVMSTVPLSTETTRPRVSTVATDVSVLNQARARPAISLPSASKAAAESDVVSPSDANSIASGAIVTLAGGVRTVTATSAVTSLDTAKMSACPRPTAVTRPVPSTLATAVSLDSQATGAPSTA